MRVVIADDNLKMCMGIKKIIADKFPHFTVEGTFEDGESLMEYLDNHIPDLLITDICMPSFDGLEACRKLREKSASTNIILITGYKNFEYAKEAIRYKVHDLLVKPFSSDQLIEAIISAVNDFNSDSNTIAAETPQHYIVSDTKAYVEKHYSDPSLSRTQNVDAALLRIRKSQLITLHAQISPHLLGNALEAIKWEIIDKLGYNTQLEHAIASLSLFLEDSYEYQQMITSIGAEIERTKYYADMMVYCFFDRLQIEWDVAEDVMDCAIVSMSLQPFFENSISHGFSRKEKYPKITVRISSSDDLIYIEIEDNGRGMSEATLSSIMESLKDDEYGHKHIGIKNSHLKLKLLFGEEYGVTDIQTGETGTYVKITIPKIEAP